MQKLTLAFPVWALLFSSVAFWMPHLFTPMKGAIVPFLVVIMFGMGMTLTVADFKRVVQSPRQIGLGVFLQYAVMPLAAFVIAKALRLPDELLVGLVLLGSCPGGTASNVICYLAQANVALSITLTLTSTLLAVVATPVLTWLYVGQQVPVPVNSMLISVLKIVLVPVALGVVINTFWGHAMARFKAVFPFISMLAIIVIIAVIVALSQEKIAAMGVMIALAVILHNLTGLVSGYYVTRWLGFDKATCRTLAIEVGMQNSGLGVALATKYFTPLAALPSALFSIWHNLSGSALAGYWSRTSLGAVKKHLTTMADERTEV